MITSLQNPVVKEFKKTIASASKRRAAGLVFLEGPHLIEEAVAKGCTIECLILTEKYEEAFPDCNNKIFVSDHVSQKLSETKAPQGALALVNRPPLPDKPDYQKVLILDQIQDPGNLGSIIRSAAAFGFEAVFVLDTGGCDPWSPKVLRSAQGGHFFVDIWDQVSIETVKQKFTHTFYSAEPLGELKLSDIDPSTPKGYILGNEGQGVSEDVKKAFDTQSVRIEMNSGFESLNVAIAAGIILYSEGVGS